MCYVSLTLKNDLLQQVQQNLHEISALTEVHAHIAQLQLSDLNYSNKLKATHSLQPEWKVLCPQTRFHNTLMFYMSTTSFITSVPALTLMQQLHTSMHLCNHETATISST